MTSHLIPTNTAPIEVEVVAGELVLSSRAAKAFAVAFTAEAVLASLEPLRLAAHAVLRDRPAR